jgi:PiT family inorganic phosphate transporter
LFRRQRERRTDKNEHPRAQNSGANDNFKGVATLFGTGTANYKVAIGWATFTTFTGSLAALFLASALVNNFSGKGLVPDTLFQGPEFAIAVALGAGGQLPEKLISG